jgi:hypothetical protein
MPSVVEPALIGSSTWRESRPFFPTPYVAEQFQGHRRSGGGDPSGRRRRGSPASPRRPRAMAASQAAASAVSLSRLKRVWT